MSEKISGVVKWFNKEKGFGFIKGNSDDKDYFVHFSAILSDGYKTIPDGANVLFVPAEGKKGPQAEEVEVIS